MSENIKKQGEISIQVRSSEGFLLTEIIIVISDPTYKFDKD